MSNAVCVPVVDACVDVHNDANTTQVSDNPTSLSIELAPDWAQAAYALGELALLLTSAAQLLSEAARAFTKAQTTTTTSFGRTR